MKFKYKTLIGVVVSLTFVLLGILDTSGKIKVSNYIPDFLHSHFLHPAGIFIVFGGVLSAMFIMYPSNTVIEAILSVRYIFSHSDAKADTLYEEVGKIVGWADEIRKNKAQFFAGMKKSELDDFTVMLFDLYNTNYTSDEIRKMGETNIEKEFNKNSSMSDVIQSAAVLAPALGMVGTVLGMVVMLSNMSDPANIGPGISTGLMGTLYGVLSANLLFNPLSKKIRFNAYNVQIRESLMLEAIILIKENKSSIVIQDKLYSLIGRSISNDKQS
jgi:chemotaxis protein MotA